MSKSNINKNEKLIAGLVTSVYGIAIIAIMLLIQFSKPAEPEEEGGLLVDFGYTDEGYGAEEPQVNPEFTQPINENPVSATAPPDQSAENLVTQDNEESASINKTTDPKAAVTENEEKIVQKPSEPILPKIEERKPNQKAIFTGFSKKSNSTSEGNGTGTGNKGVLDGGESDIYSGRSTGLGTAGDGNSMIGKGLLGRKLTGIPDINDNSNKTGKIIIKVKVDNNGNVISADYTAEGSTLSDNELVEKCEAAARKARFSSSAERDVDYGTLVFKFSIK